MAGKNIGENQAECKKKEDISGKCHVATQETRHEVTNHKSCGNI